jgi:hypothetical protein
MMMTILAPFFAMMFLTMIVWVYMYARRLPFIFRNRLTPEQLRPEEFARLQPPEVSTPSDNLKNLFEIPTLFYALVLCLYVTQQADTTHIVAAWVFVAFRALHSLVHCTFNHVPLRFMLYAISTLAFFFMVVRAALQIL